MGTSSVWVGGQFVTVSGPGQGTPIGPGKSLVIIGLVANLYAVVENGVVMVAVQRVF